MGRSLEPSPAVPLRPRVRELIERSDPVFVMTIEAMLDVRRAILEGYDRLHRALLQVV
ncbi:hypothetical protein ABIF99_011630 [Bradyrhizobium japonicum]